MVVGTIGGALAGNAVQKKHDQPQSAQQVIVRVKSGVLVAITQPVDARLAVGQRVYIEGSGEGARVVPQ
jgi:outer membrane lipoprotein SlyB